MIGKTYADELVTRVEYALNDAERLGSGNVAHKKEGILYQLKEIKKIIKRRYYGNKSCKKCKNNSMSNGECWFPKKLIEFLDNYGEQGAILLNPILITVDGYLSYEEK